MFANAVQRKTSIEQKFPMCMVLALWSNGMQNDTRSKFKDRSECSIKSLKATTRYDEANDSIESKDCSCNIEHKHKVCDNS